MSTLKEKTIQGVSWNMLGGFLSQGVNLLTGIVLARLLLPADFGAISLIMVIIAFLDLFVDGGFSQALIRKYHCTESDYSTAFYFNLLVSILLYLILFFSADFVSQFFKLTNFAPLFKVLGLSVIINAFAQIQYTILQIKMDYRSQFIVAFVSSLLSGVAGILFAYRGFGVWSLVWQLLCYKVVNCLLLVLLCRWRPSLLFDQESFRDMFGFGSKLLAAGFINTLFNNFYYIIIGKIFSPAELGYFGRAEQLANLPSSNLTRVINKVSGPVLASIKDDPVRLKESYKKLIRLTMFITFFVMLTLFAISRSLILTLFTVKWQNSILYLQLLCWVMMLYPLHSLNLGMIGISGRSDLILKLEIWKKIIFLPILALGFFVSIKLMLSMMILFSFGAYFLNSYYSTKVLDYPIKEQICDIMPSFLICFMTAIVVLLGGIGLESYLFKSQIIILIFQLLGSIITISLLSSIFKNREMLELRGIIKGKLGRFNLINRISR